ncbi:MAG: amidase [Spirochaetales bacterium]|nr:amidase [Spirochaetales bacterium]
MEFGSIAELAREIAGGGTGVRKAAEAYIGRIERLDRNGPRVNSVIELNPDAMEIADALDRELAAGKSRGPLHGVPVLLKDNIDTGDRMATSAGSIALEGSTAPRDAFLVSRLREAGALILGKTNLSEWANFRGERSTSGWSSRGGLTRNPHALDRSACGSSSGSAAAVAAGFCAAAVGTETDGSIICPAQTCGVAGLKPTLGLISRTGIIPIAHSQDTAGPMARSVEDLAILLGAMTGYDPEDAEMRAAGARERLDYTRFLGSGELGGSRLGVARSLAGKNPKILAVFERSLETLRKLGALLVDPVELPKTPRLGEYELEVLHGEFKADLDAYLATRGADVPVKSMEELVRFNEAHADRTLVHFGQEHLIAALEKAAAGQKSCRKARDANRRMARRAIDGTLRRYGLDALVVPSGGPAWPIDLVNGDAIEWGVDSTSLPAVAGYPHLTVPAGFITGLPTGLSFIGTAWAEPALLRLGHAFERAAGARRDPRFLERVEF